MYRISTALANDKLTTRNVYYVDMQLGADAENPNPNTDHETPNLVTVIHETPNTKT